MFVKAELEESIVKRFLRQVEHHPRQIALKDGPQTWTFLQVNEASDRIAADLLSRCGEAAEAVALLFEYGPAAIIAMLAVLKAGKYYVPVDPSYPPPIIAHMLADSEAGIILTDSATRPLVDHLPADALTVIDTGEIGKAAGISPQISIGPDALACLLYTSGSTGLPKGIMHTHRSILHHVWSQTQAFGLGPTDRQALLLSFSYAASISEIFGALLNGATLSFNDIKKTGLENLAGWIATERITAFKLSVSLFRLFLRTLKERLSAPGLRLVILGGDQLLRTDVELFRRFFPEECLLVNRLASTEAFTITRQVIDKTTPLTSPVVSIGHPDYDKTILILDENDRPATKGEIGEIVVASPYLSPGYWRLPELNQDRFRFRKEDQTGPVFYTGDLGRIGSDGRLEHFGRKDDQVKIRGYRVSLSNVTAALKSLDEVRDAIVVVLDADRSIGGKKLAAYLVLSHPGGLSISRLRRRLAQKLPAYMIPASFVILEKFSLTGSGKIDRQALPPPERARPPLDCVYVAPRTPLEQNLRQLWSEILELETVGMADNFFDLGGDSLTLFWMHTRIQEIFELDIPLVMLFKYPTIAALARYIAHRKGLCAGTEPGLTDEPPVFFKENPGQRFNNRKKNKGHPAHEEIAIIGMAATFPDAENIDKFWENIQNGVSSLQHFSREELLEAGISESELDDPNYVRVGTLLKDIEKFDAAFFGLTPPEAAVLDPQQRLLLETAWHALENAGYIPDDFNGRVGIYAGASPSIYLQQHILPQKHLLPEINDVRIRLSNDPEFLTTRLAYKLNLKGPAINVATACSTSLVAVHLACQGLLRGECELALAGGTALETLQKTGYHYQEGWIVSPDGSCRPFDAEARGTVAGNGAGLVLLKRLNEAIRDGDCIHAVIKGSAVNNDGAFRMGFTAPGIDGQAAVIEAAYKDAGINPETVSCVEAHGTGTTLGDPVEIAALTQAFRRFTWKTGFCAIGSVKSNIGHASRAAGIAGLIKTVMALKHHQIPPSLNFTRPNPEIDFSSSPFYVNTSLQPWPKPKDRPRRASVSSFGIGGTNAHLVVEEWNPKETTAPSKPWQLLVLSAKSESALETATQNLLDFLNQNPDKEFADVAYTLQVGRQAFSWRRALVCRNREEAVSLLASPQSSKVKTHHCKAVKPALIFIFQAEDAYYDNIAVDLYEQEPDFRVHVDHAAALFQPSLQMDLRNELLSRPDKPRSKDGAPGLRKIRQAVLFTVEYALARLLMSWGAYPEALFGDGVGEYAAACLSGIMALEDIPMVLTATAGAAGINNIRLEPPAIPIFSALSGDWLTPSEASDRTYWSKPLHKESHFPDGLKRLLRSGDYIGLEPVPSRSFAETARKIPDMPAAAIVPALSTTAARCSTRETLLRAVSRLWLNGIAIDWKRMHAHDPKKRIPLPLYPFEKKRYWIPRASLQKPGEPGPICFTG